MAEGLSPAMSWVPFDTSSLAKSATLPANATITPNVYLCNCCEEMLSCVEDDGFAYLHQPSYLKLRRAADDDCYFCSNILKNDKYTINRSSYKLLKINSVGYWGLYFKNAVTNSQSFECRISPPEGLNRQASTPGFGTSVPAYTGDLKVADMIKEWMLRCYSEHHCFEGDPDYTPPRLLDLTGSIPRLIATRAHILEKPSSGQSCYASLSHCWGPNPTFVTLTEQNQEEFHRDGIPLESLPLNFKHAIEVCQRLGIRYIWIDSLCILQAGEGSKEDWMHHVTEMRNVYKNAALNISATGSASADGGLYFYRDVESVMPLIVNNPRAGGSLPGGPLIVINGRLPHDTPGPLDNRGWTLQEQLLSSRIVAFGESQVYWKCPNSHGVCETYPTGIELHPQDQLIDAHKRFLRSKISHQIWTTVVQQNIREVYREVTQKYTERQLTFPDQDKFAAFASIAQHFTLRLLQFYPTRLRPERYIAGFMEDDLPLALLWKVRGQIPEKAVKRTGVYRCPSWSWAKVNVPVELYNRVPADVFIDIPENYEPRVCDAKVKDIQLSHVDPTDPYGQLKSAELVIEAVLFRLRWRRNVKGIESKVFDSMPNPGDSRRHWSLEIEVDREWEDVTLLSAEIDSASFDSEEEAQRDQEDVLFVRIARVSRYIQDVQIGLIVQRVGMRGLGLEASYARIGIAYIGVPAWRPSLDQDIRENVILI